MEPASAVPPSIVCVAADTAEADRLAAAASSSGLRAETCAPDAASLARKLAGAAVVVLDVGSLGDAAAAECVAAAAQRAQPVPCLAGLRDPTVEETVAWMRRGAFAVVRVPPDGPSFRMQVEQAARHHELSARNAELERSLESHERLAMIGKLAAGVAHELNNPLDGVLRYVNLTIDRLPKDSTQVTYLLEARRGLRRMADIVRDLLQFSRNANVEAADEDAERLARDAVSQVVETHAKGRSVEAVFEFPPAGLHLPRGMFQVLGNLAKNAVDAMPKGGTLRVSASLANGRVRIDVRDSGTGIPDEIRSRIFEPFFTTKEVGSGTGLGLPICQRIVERLGGTLSLESELGAGTTVRIDLPHRSPGAAPRRQERGSPAVRRTEGVF